MGLDNYDIPSLIAKYLSRSLTEEERTVLEKWLHEKEENRRLLNALEKEPFTDEEIAYRNNLDVDAAWQEVKNKRTQQIFSQWKLWAGAVAVLLFVFTFVWIIPSHRKQEIAYRDDKNTVDSISPGTKKATLTLSSGTQLDLSNTFKTIYEKDGTRIFKREGELNYGHASEHKGELIYNVVDVPKAGIYDLILPDGTKVWLNSMSSIRFPTQFNAAERKIFLQGEAYFEVAKDPSKPFIVDVEGTNVIVLGTVFNINAYSNIMRTALVEGSVKVLHQDNHEFLKPGQEAFINEHEIKVKDADLIKTTAWKEGEFYFKNDDISTVMSLLTRWYDVNIAYEGKAFGIKYNGSISRQAPLTDVLEMLRFVSKDEVNFSLEGRTLKVIFNKQLKPT